MKECLECHKEFSRRKGEAFKRWGERKYCSHDCANFSKERISKATQCLWGRKPPKSAFKKGQVPYNYKGGKPKCLVCEKQLSTYKVKYCKKHFGLFTRKENHHNWKGGISRDIHSVKEPKYKEWRMLVFTRDKFVCRINNKDCKGQLQAHHILRWADYPELRYDINNGITLCIAHHPRKRAEEKRLTPYFKELVSVSSD